MQSIKQSAQFLREKGFSSPKVGIVLGTGLGDFINHIAIQQAIPYNEIPNFPVSTVEFHKGQLIYGTVGETTVIAMQGRFHFYEGYTMQQITFPIRVMKELGIEYLLLSNAAGGINLNFKKGDLVLIDDHINLQGDSPLRGINDPAFGERFVDLSQPYSKELENLIFSKANDANISLKKGVYASVVGPNLETKAEYRYLKNIGADLVGMSTVPEVIVANQCNIPCAAISVVTDECDPDNLKPVNIAEIIEVAGKADKKLSGLLAEVVKQIKAI